MSDLSMKPTRDELVSRRGPAKRGGGNGNAGGGGGFWKYFSIVLLVLLAGAAGFLWFQVQQVNDILDQSLKANQEQLGSLETKVQTQVETTGDKVTQSINMLNGEVRKLWDLSNKRNRPDIEKLQVSVQSLQSRLEAEAKARAELSAQLTKAGEEVKTLKTALAKVQQETQGLGKLGELQSALAGVKSQQDKLAETQKALSGKVSAQDSRIAALGKAPSVPADVSVRLKDVEADILSINAHRQQVNSRLNQLDQDIQGLYQKR